MFHARFHARPGKNTELKRCPFCPFVLNGLVLSLLTLKSPFCPVLCPFCPSHERLKFAGTVLFLLRSRTVNMTKRVCRDFPIQNCGAKYFVRLSNHLTDVHGLDYINRRKWLQQAKLQPKVRVMIYPSKRSQGLRPTTSETLLSVQEEEKDTIVHHLSKPRGVKKSLKSLPREVKKSLKPLPRGVRKAANNIKHYTAKQQQIQFLSGSLCIETMRGQTRRRELSNPAHNTSSL